MKPGDFPGEELGEVWIKKYGTVKGEERGCSAIFPQGPLGWESKIGGKIVPGPEE